MSVSRATRMVPAAAARLIYATGGRSRWHDLTDGAVEIPVRFKRTVVAWELRGFLGGVQRVTLTRPEHFLTGGAYRISP